MAEILDWDYEVSVSVCLFVYVYMGLPQWLSGKESTCHAGDGGSIPGSGRSPGGGYGNPLQYSCLEILWREEPGGLQSMRSHKSRIET